MSVPKTYNSNTYKFQETPAYEFSEDDILTATLSPALDGLNTNLTNGNKWYAYFPIENILGSAYNGLELHLKNFSLPLMTMSTTTISYKGYQKEIPTKVMNAESKELTLTYLVDEYWQNYKALYLWMSGTGGNINNVVKNEETHPIVPSDYLPLRIYLLDNYKKKKIQFLFENCWIKVFNEISLELNNPNEVEASFTCVYDKFSIEPV